MILPGVARLAISAVALAGIVLVDGRRGRTSSRGEAITSARWARRPDVRALEVPGPVPGRVVLGRMGSHLVAAQPRHSVLVIGPTQSHKTSGFAVPAILEWSGPVLAASVKADLVSHTLGWRRGCGRVWLYDPSCCTGLGSSPWDPLSTAGHWTGARRLSHALVEAARPPAGSFADADFWYAAAGKLLAPLLFAASVSDRTIPDVARWLDEQEQAEVTEALWAAGPDATRALQALRATWSRDDRQRSAVYTTAETVLDAFADIPSPNGSGPEGAIDPAALLDGHHTLYLCAPAHEQRRLRPLFAGLSGAVLDTAFAVAARQGGPLDPPLLVVLDEAANIAPLAELDTLASTASGHGVQLVTIWQDLAQLTARYGARAGTVVNNHRVKVFLSGIADPATLEHASALIGDAEQRQRTVTLDGHGARSGSEAVVVRRLAPPDWIRRMRPGTGIVVAGHLPPIRLRLRPWWREHGLRLRAEPGVSPASEAGVAVGDGAGRRGRRGRR
jgi:type IV secretion system protein VirD4